MEEEIRLSPSALNLFNGCQRCFYLEKKLGLKQPGGIFPSLPGGMDNIIKKYYDKYIGTGDLPPDIRDKDITGKLFPDQAQMKKWRNWRATNLKYVDEDRNAYLTGALDECIILDEGYIPTDYKTRGYPLKDLNDPKKYYQTQMDCYELMFASSGYKTLGYSYLIYYHPTGINSEGLVQFEITVIKMDTSWRSAKRIFGQAVDLLRQDDIPLENPECEYCKMEKERADI